MKWKKSTYFIQTTDGLEIVSGIATKIADDVDVAIHKNKYGLYIATELSTGFMFMYELRQKDIKAKIESNTDDIANKLREVRKSEDIAKFSAAKKEYEKQTG